MKNWYAVQHGSDFDWGDGSFNKHEARKIATKFHRVYPDEEIRICICRGDICADEMVIYEGER